VKEAQEQIAIVAAMIEGLAAEIDNAAGMFGR
jgi:hypothetical protein